MSQMVVVSMFVTACIRYCVLGKFSTYIFARKDYIRTFRKYSLYPSSKSNNCLVTLSDSLLSYCTLHLIEANESMRAML